MRPTLEIDDRTPIKVLLDRHAKILEHHNRSHQDDEDDRTWTDTLMTMVFGPKKRHSQTVLQRPKQRR